MSYTVVLWHGCPGHLALSMYSLLRASLHQYCEHFHFQSAESTVEKLCIGICPRARSSMLTD